MGKIAAALAWRLEREGTPERASGEKRYLKSDLKFFGTGVPAIRRAVRDALREQGELQRRELLAIVEKLWDSDQPVHELRRAAVELLCQRTTLLETHDLALVERLLREARTWALVDELAVRVAGDLYARNPLELELELSRWEYDDDFWIRRSALLVHLLPLRVGNGDFERFTRAAESMLVEREFFIRKAIGWVLRETAKKRPELVATWLEPRAGRAAGLTVREAVRHMPEGLRARVLEARQKALGRPRP